MIALLALAAATPLPAGAFRHGEWIGRCYRDGYMDGRAQEECRARRDGAVVVTIVRRAGALSVSARPRGCTVKLPPRVIAGDLLEGMRRDVVVVQAIEASTRDAWRRCHSRGRLPDLDTAALHDVLVETDDLEVSDE